MNLGDYINTSMFLFETATGIEHAKRAGYTMGSEDVLANFKRIAERAGLTAGQVWTVYFLKHVDAIAAAMSRPELAQAEPLEERFADCLNYLKLGFALFGETGNRFHRPSFDKALNPAVMLGLPLGPEAELPSGFQTNLRADEPYRRFPPI